MRRKKRKRRRRGASPLFVMNSGPRGPWPERAAVVVGVEPWGAQETSLTHPLTYNCNSASSWPPEHNGREWAGGTQRLPVLHYQTLWRGGGRKTLKFHFPPAKGKGLGLLFSLSLSFFSFAPLLSFSFHPHACAEDGSGCVFCECVCAMLCE